MNEQGLIREYFSHHKLSPTGIRNFLQGKTEIREWLQNEVRLHPEYQSIGNYVLCFLKNIRLPSCKVCSKTLTYKQYKNKRPYCSKQCFYKDCQSVVTHRKNTLKQRYGVENPSELDFVKEKRKKTLKQRYGVEYITQNKKFVQKAKNTMIQKYGVDSYLKTQEHRQKYLKKIYQTFLKLSDYVIPLFTEDEYKGWKQGQVYKWKCTKCGNEFESKVKVSNVDVSVYTRIPRCLKCYPFSGNSSFLEKEVIDFIKSVYPGKIIENDRKTIKPLELDIVIPEKKIAIEFDGLFWHNENSGKDKNYHLHKTNRCEAEGYQLIHIFEDEWVNKQNIVKDKIKSVLGIYDKRIYARCCKIREIEKTVSDMFLLENHLQGKDNASIRYGLYYNDELVSVMTFGKPRFNKHYDFELIRFASKLGVQVIGGFSKLLKYFERKHGGKSIISYADRRYSKGNVYLKSGFELKMISRPNYFWQQNKEKLTRYQCQKHKLKQVLGKKFNPLLSETENMLANGYSRIFDCGNLVFVKE